MLGDSVKKRQGTRSRPTRKKAPAKKRLGWKLWAALLAALALPFVIGYVVAVRVLFPPPPVVAEGIAVPSVIGQDAETAQRALVDAGLGRLTISELPSLTVAEGLIIAQSPLAGQQLRAAGPVQVAVSSGSPRVLVPDVTGFPFERAASLLARLGFRVQRTDSVAQADAGIVVGLNPRAGTQLRLPASVSITVSSGMPDPIDTDTIGVDTATVRIGWSDRAAGRMFTDTQVFTPITEARTNGR